MVYCASKDGNLTISLSEDESLCAEEQRLVYKVWNFSVSQILCESNFYQPAMAWPYFGETTYASDINFVKATRKFQYE